MTTTSVPVDDEGRPDDWDETSDRIQAEAERRYGIESDRRHDRRHFHQIGF